MKLEGEQVLLRVYLRNTDQHGWRSAADELLERARAAGLAGATIFRGFLGLDCRGELLESKTWSLTEHVPVIVEIVDGASRIGRFLSTVTEVVLEGIATLERAHVLVYRNGRTEFGRLSSLVVPNRIADLSTLPGAEEFPIMKLSHEGQLLRVFIGESDEWQGAPLYRAIVLEAKRLSLAGATVLRGSMGYGANSRIHAAKLLDISTDLPILIEIVDEPGKINTLLPFLDEAVKEGLITIEAVRVLKYLANRGVESPAAH